MQSLKHKDITLYFFVLCLIFLVCILFYETFLFGLAMFQFLGIHLASCCHVGQ